MLASLKQVFPGLTYKPGNSIIHNLNPVIKFFILVFFSIAVFYFPQVLPSMFLFIFILGGYLIGGLGGGFFLKKLRFILIFGIMIVLVQILVVDQGYLITSFTIFNKIRLEIWSAGLANGLVMMFRFVNIIASSYLFVVTTDPNKLVYGLMQMGLPYRYGFMLITALRFIPLFEQELTSIRSAQMAKGMDLDGLSIKKLIRMVRYLITPLVISALNKIDYLAVSMESRAFGLYPTRSYLHKQNIQKTDWFWLIIIPISIFLFCLYLT